MTISTCHPDNVLNDRDAAIVFQGYRGVPDSKGGT